jgi:DNA-binding NtrC family response regulator
MPDLLIVDDESALRRAVVRWFARRGVVVHGARGVTSAKVCFERYPLAGAFIDLWLGDGTGLELYEWIAGHHPAVASRVAFLTGDLVGDALDGRHELRRIEALGRPVLTKPFEFAALERLADRWLGEAEGSTRDRNAPPPPTVQGP